MISPFGFSRGKSFKKLFVVVSSEFRSKKDFERKLLIIRSRCIQSLVHRSTGIIIIKWYFLFRQALGQRMFFWIANVFRDRVTVVEKVINWKSFFCRPFKIQFSRVKNNQFIKCFFIVKTHGLNPQKLFVCTLKIKKKSDHDQNKTAFA